MVNNAKDFSDMLIQKYATFGLIIWDYSYPENRLLPLAKVCPTGYLGYLADLERAFPSVSGEARRLFGRTVREERIGIWPINLMDEQSFIAVATPNDLMLFGAKSDSVATNHEILGLAGEEIGKTRQDFPSLKREMSKIVRFERPNPSLLVERPLAALS